MRGDDDEFGLKTCAALVCACRSVAVLILAAGWFLPLTNAHAQLPTKIFVASFGSDANDGSRGSPKRNFQPAHDAVATGGQIVVLDTAGYGALAITKNLSVTVPPGVNGFVTVTGASDNGITINAASASVSLRGLIVEGGGASGTGTGILANSVGNLAIEDSTVRNFSKGIYAFSSTAAKVFVRRCTARGCANGLDVETNGPVSDSAIATGCLFAQNTTAGVVAFPLIGSSGDLTLVGCVSSGNATGVRATGAVVVRVDRCRITGNTSSGADVLLGGQVLSSGNNTLENNGGPNTFPGGYCAK
jgi:hypothetical protein